METVLAAIYGMFFQEPVIWVSGSFGTSFAGAVWIFGVIALAIVAARFINGRNGRS